MLRGGAEEHARGSARRGAGAQNSGQPVGCSYFRFWSDFRALSNLWDYLTSFQGRRISGKCIFSTVMAPPHCRSPATGPGQPLSLFVQEKLVRSSTELRMLAKPFRQPSVKIWSRTRSY